MTPQQALSILDQASARAVLTRAEHETVVQAIQALAKALAPPEPPKE